MTCPQDCSAIGKVSRIYANQYGAYFRLADLPSGDTPGDGHYFILRNEHPNYNALYSLALVAAANRYDVWIRTERDINPQENAVVSYLVVDWS